MPLRNQCKLMTKIIVGTMKVSQCNIDSSKSGVIQQNESELANVDFEVQPNNGNKVR